MNQQEINEALIFVSRMNLRQTDDQFRYWTYCKRLELDQDSRYQIVDWFIYAAQSFFLLPVYAWAQFRYFRLRKRFEFHPNTMDL